jgi:acyl-CoA thioesterase
MAGHAFDEATAVVFNGRQCRGRTDDRYWAFVGPFGGVTAATVLRAVLGQGARVGNPVAITLNFCAPIQRGAFDLDVREVRTNRSTQHWSVELSQPESGVALTATVVLAVRRDSWSHQPARPPDRAPPEELPLFAPETPLPTWVDQYRFRFVAGEPVLGSAAHAAPASAVSRLWITDREPRRIDALSLVAMSDAFFGRIFQVRGAVCPFGTVSMTVYLHASSDELAEEVGGTVFGVADAHIFHKSFADQIAELWSPAGRLLATAHQATYFKA